MHLPTGYVPNDLRAFNSRPMDTHLIAIRASDGVFLNLNVEPMGKKQPYSGHWVVFYATPKSVFTNCFFAVL